MLTNLIFITAPDAVENTILVNLKIELILESNMEGLDNFNRVNAIMDEIANSPMPSVQEIEQLVKEQEPWYIKLISKLLGV